VDVALQQEGRTIGRAVFVPAYGLAALRAGWSVVRHLEVQDIRGPLHLRIPEIHYVEEFDAASGRRVEQHAPERIAAMETALESVLRPRSLLCHVESDGGRIGAAPLSVLPPWSWPLFPEARLLTASWVLPGEGATQRIAQRVRERLGSGSSGSGGACPVDLLHAAHETVREQFGFRPEAPRLQNEPWSDCTHQAIRSVEELFADAASPMPATCLDLSLALAGVLEHLGANPVLLFVGDDAAAPEHVVLGVWDRVAQRYRPLLDDTTSLRQAVTAGELHVLEATSLWLGDQSDDTASVATSEARPSATRRVAEAASLVAVDVCAARPPAGVIAPLVVADAPAVTRAMEESRRFALRTAATRNETVHLLYGLCRAAGELTTWLLETQGSRAEALAARIEAMQTSRRGEQGADPVPTRNHTLCLSTARGNARSRGASSVAEGDLLWAVLENPSASIRRVLEQEGCRPSRLQRELGTRFERPGLSTSLSWTAPRSEDLRERSQDA
jgi:hypothetical protein